MFGLSAKYTIKNYKFMSKFMNQESQDQVIKELMVSIHRNTQGSKCIDVFETLLKEVSDKNVIYTAVVDMHRFVSEFSRLCRDIDNMRNIDFISKMLTDEFFHPERFFVESRKLAELYLYMSDVLEDKYKYIVQDIEKKVVLSGRNRLGQIYHKESYTAQDILNVTKFFGNLSDLSADEVKEKYELARQVVLLYNYMPAIVKAFIQTKRRSLDLDRNSTKFGN